LPEQFPSINKYLQKFDEKFAALENRTNAPEANTRGVADLVLELLQELDVVLSPGNFSSKSFKPFLTELFKKMPRKYYRCCFNEFLLVLPLKSYHDIAFDVITPEDLAECLASLYEINVYIAGKLLPAPLF
jgi:hypothetical protein